MSSDAFLVGGINFGDEFQYKGAPEGVSTGTATGTAGAAGGHDSSRKAQSGTGSSDEGGPPGRAPVEEGKKNGGTGTSVVPAAEKNIALLRRWNDGGLLSSPHSEGCSPTPSSLTRLDSSKSDSSDTSALRAAAPRRSSTEEEKSPNNSFEKNGSYAYSEQWFFRSPTYPLWNQPFGPEETETQRMDSMPESAEDGHFVDQKTLLAASLGEPVLVLRMWFKRVDGDPAGGKGRGDKGRAWGIPWALLAGAVFAVGVCCWALGFVHRSPI